MQVGLFGGSFNPPHVGHAMVVSWLIWTEQVDEVWLMPTYEHAFDKELIPFDVRIRACEALAGLFPGRVSVCPIESELPKPSYTYNSLQALSERHQEHQFRLVAGSDILDQVHAWHRWEEIVNAFSPIVVSRSGHRILPGTPVFPKVSSTDVRKLLRAGGAANALVPQAVLDIVGNAYRGES